MFWCFVYKKRGDTIKLIGRLYFLQYVKLLVYTKNMDQYTHNETDRQQFKQKPHKVNRKAIIVAILLFGLIVVGMFVFAFLKKAEIQNNTVNTATEESKAEVKYAAITRVDAKHFYTDGVHTLVGEVTMPTSCDLLEARVTVAESYPEQIGVNFTVINTTEFCPQTPTAQRFKVSATASADAMFSALFMGREVELNLIPAAEGESPDDFELFIKG